MSVLLHPGILFALTYLLAVALVIVPVGYWEFLGERSVSHRLDHESLVFAAPRQDLRCVRLIARNSVLDFRRVVVHFANGRNREIELPSGVPSGGRPFWDIEVGGTGQPIRSLDFWYDSQRMGERQAVVRILASTYRSAQWLGRK